MSEIKNSTIKENLSSIKEKIALACKKSNRSENSVRLVAVSKFHPKEAVEDAIFAGQNLFGENRVQEAFEKFALLPETASLHIIGSLQRNKVQKALSIRQLTMIESVDRIELLEEIEKVASKINRKIDVLFEIHTGEESKAGFRSEDDVCACLKAIALGKITHVNVRGFMTMAPATQNEEKIRESFRSMRLLRDKMSAEFPSLDLSELSMGMSDDFLIGIEEGATIVRIGSAIFGERTL